MVLHKNTIKIQFEKLVWCESINGFTQWNVNISGSLSGMSDNCKRSYLWGLTLTLFRKKFFCLFFIENISFTIWWVNYFYCRVFSFFTWLVNYRSVFFIFFFGGSTSVSTCTLLLMFLKRCFSITILRTTKCQWRCRRSRKALT